MLAGGEPGLLQERSGQGHAVDIPVVTCTTKVATRKIRLNRDALDWTEPILPDQRQSQPLV